MAMTRWALVLAMALLLSACGGGDGGDGADLTGGPDTTTDTPGTEGDVTEETSPADVPPVCPSTNWVLEFFGLEDGSTIETGEVMLLQARIYDPVHGEVIAGQTVTFGLAGEGDAALQETSAVTNDMGVAAVNFDTGSALEVAYTLTASNPCTESVTITLSTVAPEQGTFLVTYTISDELAELWPSLSLEAYADNTIPLCGKVNYTNPGSQGVPLPDGEDTVEFPQVMANSAYVVFGIARNEDGAAVGGGCAEMVSVLPDKTKEVQVTLEPLNMDPVGGYDVTFSVPVLETLGDQWVDVGGTLQQVVDNSGEIIAQKVLDDLAIWFPDGLPECPDSDAEEDIVNSINAGLATIDTTKVDWVAAQADALLQELAADVQLRGKWLVDTTETQGVYSAAFTLEKLQFSGSVDCGEADCADWLIFAPESFSLGDVKLTLDQFEMLLTASGFDQLTAAQFNWQVPPGKLMLFAFANVVLPLSGADSNEVADLFESLYSCNTLLSQVTAPTIACLNKPQTALIESCEKAVENMSQAFYAQMAGLTAEQHLVVSGAFASVDDDGDLVADHIEGELDGDLVIEDATMGPFAGSVQADRK